MQLTGDVYRSSCIFCIAVSRTERVNASAIHSAIHDVMTTLRSSHIFGFGDIKDIYCRLLEAGGNVFHRNVGRLLPYYTGATPSLPESKNSLRVALAWILHGTLLFSSSNSPDLSPSDLHLFTHLKQFLGGTRMRRDG
jgi:hypothetical protein